MYVHLSLAPHSNNTNTINSFVQIIRTSPLIIESKLNILHVGKRRYNIKLWKVFTDCFNCLPIAAIIDEKIFCMHGGLSPDLKTMEQIRRVVRPTDVPDTGMWLVHHHSNHFFIFILLFKNICLSRHFSLSFLLSN